MTSTTPVAICMTSVNTRTMPQIHIQFRFFGVGMNSVSYNSPAMGRRRYSHFSPSLLGS